MALVSIIMPVYNGSLFIHEALESVQKQTHSLWECIIVNDGSSDDSRCKVEKFIENDSRFKLINIQNSGVSVARNTAVLNSKGTYIFPLDADDKIQPKCIRRCLSEFERNPDLKLVCPQGQLFGTDMGLWNLPNFDYKTMLKYNMIHNSSLFTRNDFDRVGGYRTNMVNGLEDWDFYIALLYGCKNEQVVKVDEPLFYYRVNQAGRRLTVAASNRQNDMLDLLIYNNFQIYKEYFPNIFNRVLEYDFDNLMLNKGPVKFVTNMLITISNLKNKFLKSRNLAERPNVVGNRSN